MATRTKKARNPGIRPTTKSLLEWVEIPIVGTAPLLVSHHMPWDHPSYYDDLGLEIKNEKLKFLEPDQVALLDRLRDAYPTYADEMTYDENRLSATAEVFLRGYWLPDLTPAYVTRGFSLACLNAVAKYRGPGRTSLSKGKVSAALRIRGSDPSDQTLVPIHGAKPSIQTDMGRAGDARGTPRVIRRLRFEPGWSTTLVMGCLPALLSVTQGAQIVAWSGEFGVGQWRPSSNHPGDNGTYQVVSPEEMP